MQQGHTPDGCYWSTGACYFLSKPVDLDVLVTQMANAVAAMRPRDEPSEGRTSSVELADDPLLARSTVMLQIKALLEKIASTPSSTVLLTGESGVGKDAAARYLHRASVRASQPFVNVTCSALPEQLLESELFGHERGAFTDAKQRKLGLLEQAAGGTAFLDEIGEIAPGLQAKLLRFLEDRTFRRVGGSVELRPDVRVVAATNRDLARAVQSGDFRQDLYYRLAVLHVRIPALRERKDDIEPLCSYFIARYSRLFGVPGRKLSAKALAKLVEHSWPGNVRELKNVIERTVLMAEGPCLEADDLVLEAGTNESDARPVVELPVAGLKLDEVEKELLVQALERTRGNKTRAALLLGLTRDQVRHRVEKFGLGERFPPGGDD